MRLCADPILPPPLEFYTYIHRTPPPPPPLPAPHIKPGSDSCMVFLPQALKMTHGINILHFTFLLIFKKS